MPNWLAFIQVEKEISEKSNLNKINIIVNSIGVVSRLRFFLPVTCPSRILPLSPKSIRAIRTFCASAIRPLRVQRDGQYNDGKMALTKLLTTKVESGHKFRTRYLCEIRSSIFGGFSY